MTKRNSDQFESLTPMHLGQIRGGAEHGDRRVTPRGVQVYDKSAGGWIYLAT
jgi:hypothetical protein